MTGRVARWHGQQRVAVIVDDLVTVCTAYVPSAFLDNNLKQDNEYVRKWI